MTSPLPSDLESAVATSDIATVLGATLTHFGCQAGTVHLLREGVLKLAAHKNIPPPVVQIVETVPIGKGIAGLAAQRLEPITICNLQTDTSGQAKPGAKATGMEGSVAVPMLVDGKLRGVLGIAKADAYDWPAAETDLLTRVAGALAARLPQE
ncbi:MAG: GAF domain-containing protein [Chthoniobacter sp.]|uniref:GAF domain-containing protein n=1 Tax=Chthoniobacter sp. TaxID=2510640 RepID=UPI0032A1FAD8